MISNDILTSFESTSMLWEVLKLFSLLSYVPSIIRYCDINYIPDGVLIRLNEYKT
jgi:hypothetical protein